MEDPTPKDAAARYLGVADRLLPGRIAGFYVVGSAALGAFRAGRSDVDFVAVLDGDLAGAELRRLRAVHAATAGRAALRAPAHGGLALAETCNGVFVRASDLTRPVTEIAPVASHVGRRFAAGRAFDVNPVTWKVLAERGITVRGPVPGSLGLDPQTELLRAWNLANLDAYWRPWATALLRRPGAWARLRPGWTTAWGALGASRLHRTVATGEVVSKEAAGEHALGAFGSRWHPIVREALAYRRREAAGPEQRSARARTEETAAFVLEVVRAARAL